ncbi:helix-turn-helix domain-containing protein [Amycolatopsis sp. NPDC051373]|uniref:leucine zipper domain-containing protein n=1 Tax=Amycolatopsis sp. NPDC051373 TaxID=3155801 RepID=UPI00344EA3CA
MVLADGVASTMDRRAERIVFQCAEGRQEKEIAARAGVSRLTVDVWLARDASDGIDGLLGHCRAVHSSKCRCSSGTLSNGTGAFLPAVLEGASTVIRDDE